MASRFDYLDAMADKAVEAERTFERALLGSKEGAIATARSRNQLFLSRMNEQAREGFEQALEPRRLMLSLICQDIAATSLSMASAITDRVADDSVQSMVEDHVSFTLERLDSDAQHRIGRHQLDMKRISILARSMRDRNAWDTSATLLRARESVDQRSAVSTDSIGRKQRTERYTRLFVRGLGLAVLVDSVVAMSRASRYRVMTFEGEALDEITIHDFEALRESLFHPQSRRYLLPSGK